MEKWLLLLALVEVWVERMLYFLQTMVQKCKHNFDEERYSVTILPYSVVNDVGRAHDDTKISNVVVHEIRMKGGVAVADYNSVTEGVQT
jgi:hypothetical protein